MVMVIFGRKTSTTDAKTTKFTYIHVSPTRVLEHETGTLKHTTKLDSLLPRAISNHGRSFAHADEKRTYAYQLAPRLSHATAHPKGWARCSDGMRGIRGIRVGEICGITAHGSCKRASSYCACMLG